MPAKKDTTRKSDFTKEIESNQADPKDTEGYSVEQLIYLALSAQTPPQKDAAMTKLFEAVGRPKPIDTGYAVGSVVEYRGSKIDGATGEVSLSDAPDGVGDAEAQKDHSASSKDQK